MTDAFYNTIGASGALLDRYERENLSQEDALRIIFTKHAPFGLTPSQAHRALNTRAPLTSIRRAITTLAKRGVLTRTHEQSEGLYGKLEYRWKLRTEPKQERLI